MRRDEQGFALPLVIGVAMTVMILIMFWITHSARHHRITQLYWERMQTRYTAESGLAAAQIKWSQSPVASAEKFPIPGSEETFHVNGKRVVVHTVARNERAIRVRAIAHGRWDVKQTVEVELDPNTLAIRRWIR